MTSLDRNTAPQGFQPHFFELPQSLTQEQAFALELGQTLLQLMASQFQFK